MVYTLDFKATLEGASTSITSNALSVITGDYINVVVVTSDNANTTTFTISNNGDAITWGAAKQTTNTNLNCKVVHWSGVAGATPPTTVTVTCTAGASPTAAKALTTIVHTGQHSTNPLPAGNLFSGAGGTDVSQAITPTSAGSNLWFVCGDWSATNSYVAAANCTLAATAAHEAGIFTAVPVRPTTQPRTDTTAFTIGETDTAGKITWVAFEVQSAPPTSTFYYQNQFSVPPNLRMR